MTPTGPGWRLLADTLRLDDPVAELTARHPAGDRCYRLVRVLCQTAAELDTYYADAQRAGAALRRLRTATGQPADGSSLSSAVQAAARELELAIERCELSDTALIRLLGTYLDLEPSDLGVRRTRDVGTSP